MRIIYFHQYFSTISGSNGTRSYEFASELIREGNSVTIVCLKTDRSNTGIKGNVIDGFRRGYVNGIDVIEFDIKYSNKKSIFARSLIFLEFTWRSSLLVFKEEADLIIATSTPLTISIPGILARWFKGIPFIFEVRDLWPQLPKAMGVIKNPIILSILSLLEWISYKSADHCIGLAPGICDEIKSNNISSKKVSLIPNACDLNIFKPLEIESKYVPNSINKTKLTNHNNIKFIAAFTGAHGIANGLDSILDGAKKLLDLGRDEIHIILIGDGSCKQKLIERANNENIYNCHFINSISKYELSKILRNHVNVGLMVLKDIPEFYNSTSPNKFFDYLSSGLPILINYPGWIADIVVSNQIGISVEPNKSLDFAKGLIDLYEDKILLKSMSFKARKLAEEEFSRKDLSNRFVQIVRKTYLENKLRLKHYFSNQIYIFFKSICDKLLAIIILILLSPILFLIFLILKFTIGDPVFFAQKRPGFKTKPFKLLKFRTMKNTRDKNGILISDHLRISKFGKFLRQTSLDELPSLINIIRGEMSFIGPRPLLMEYLDSYNDEQITRHNCYPGLTGWAQIKGRNLISWEEKFKLDIWYTNNFNIFLDLFIILITFKKVFYQEGITTKNGSQMPFFKGSKND